MSNICMLSYDMSNNCRDCAKYHIACDGNEEMQIKCPTWILISEFRSIKDKLHIVVDKLQKR